ncbi:hypothetical protein BC332_04986 [Capsicum chinense]|uniref:Uncharacterized protein n=1 Tax=Capsicum annuum TaxID=4072 RepID=A0A2G3A9L6_CAPAN|nr:putative LRR receptor-like serine/threonine-protein kinase-like [Capsicum annuum]PHT90881.1 hypothetical protein T459_05994 [Capsicum annuum]PHU26654.1 hypothetical protein BC332_04986 [Capsicum chinense]
MAKSMRSKREKRLRAIRREIVATEPTVLKKEAAKLAAQEAALAAPKLVVKSPFTSMSMDTSASTSNNDNKMDVEMADGSQRTKSLKPLGKKMKKKLKIAKKKNHGKGKIRKKNI